jgi:hypothetical protein
VGTQGQAQALDSQAPPVIVPFGRSAKWHGEQGVTQTLAAPWGTQQQFLVPSYGYLRAIYLSIVATGGNLTAATAHADAPFNVLNNILVADVNGTPIVNLDGYANYLSQLYGAYRAFGSVPLPAVNPSGASALLDASAASYAPVSASNGTFKLIHRIFHEFARDGLGCLPNMDASAAYKVTLTYNSSVASATGVYTAETGTTAPTLTTTLEGLMRSRPAGADAQGRTQEVQPPSPGTVQYWSSQTFQVSAGSNTLILSRVGNIIRNHILVFRDASGSRANADSTSVTPTTLELDWDAGQRFILNVATLRTIAAEINNFDNPAGVVPLQYTDDPNGIAINEYGDGWIPTVGSTKLQFRFTSSAAGTLQVITNDIVPGASDIYNLGQLSGR